MSNIDYDIKLYSDLKALKKVLVSNKSYEGAELISTHIKISAEKIADEVANDYHVVSYSEGIINEEATAEVSSKTVDDIDLQFESFLNEKDKFIDNQIKQQKEERAINGS